MSNLSRERPLNMTEYICKQDAVDAIHEFPMFMECNEIYIYQKRIEKIPAADVAPVVHGRWMPQKGGGLCCSECGGYALDEPDGNFIHVAAPSKFCPYCGAKMGVG